MGHKVPISECSAYAFINAQLNFRAAKNKNYKVDGFFFLYFFCLFSIKRYFNPKLYQAFRIGSSYNIPSLQLNPMRSFAISALLGAVHISALVTPRASQQAIYIQPGQDLVKDTYIVTLYNNYTLEEHFTFIGKDLSQSSKKFFSLPGIDAYLADIDEYTLHELIRYDPGVRRVDHDHYVYPIKTEPSETVNYTRIVDPLAPRWTRSVLQDAGYGSAMISAAGKVDLSSNKGTYVSMIRTIIANLL